MSNAGNDASDVLPHQKQQAMWDKTLRAELLTWNLTQTHVIPIHQIDCNREVLPMGS